MAPRRPTTGQASLEYVGVLVLVGIVLAVVGAVPAVPALGASVVQALRHGICLATGAVCTPAEARRAGLEPCPVHTRLNGEDASLKLAVVKVGRNDALAIERRSDGTASVSFVDGWEAGAAIGAGVHVGPVDGAIGAGAGVSFNAGRTWEFDSWSAAEAFVHRHAPHETLTGEARAALPFTSRLGLPPAAARYEETGPYADAELTLPVPGGKAAFEGSVGALLGQRIAGARRTTYFRVTSAGSGRLGAFFASLRTAQDSGAVLAITHERGEPVEVRMLAGYSLHGAVKALHANADLGLVAERLRAAGAGVGARSADGLAAEVSATLDLRVPANRAAFNGGLRALMERFGNHAAVDVRVLRAARDRSKKGLDLGVAGAGHERIERTRDLLEAWSGSAAGGFAAREDCATSPAPGGNA